MGAVEEVVDPSDWDTKSLAEMISPAGPQQKIAHKSPRDDNQRDFLKKPFHIIPGKHNRPRNPTWAPMWRLNHLKTQRRTLQMRRGLTHPNVGS